MDMKKLTTVYSYFTLEEWKIINTLLQIELGKAMGVDRHDVLEVLLEKLPSASFDL